MVKYFKKVLTSKEIVAGVILGSGLLVVFGLLPLFLSLDPYQTSLTVFSGPSAQHLLGTNDVGQDIFAGLLVGGQNSLRVALSVGVISTCLAVLVGSLAALAGGWVDRLLMRLVDILLVIPNIFLVILIAAYFKPGLLMEILVISLLIWLAGARIIRAQVLSLKERTHIYAARLFGASQFYIFVKHLLPEIYPLIMSIFLQMIRRAVFMEAALGFLGITDPSVMSWGAMISQSLNFFYLDVWKWWLLPTSVSLALSLLSITLIGYGFEELIGANSERGKKID